MQKTIFRKCIVKSLLAASALMISHASWAFDFNKKYTEVNFLTVDVPTCVGVDKYFPPLPADERADKFYHAALKILGQNDIKNYPQMYVLADKAAEMGHWRAKLLAASLYLRNSDSAYSEFKPEKAKKYIVELMNQNVPKAFYLMGQYKSTGVKGFKEDPIPVTVYLLEATKLNDPSALSDMYDILLSTGRADDANALLNCAIAQKEDNAAALLKKANILESSEKSEKELIEAYKHLYQAAKAGSYTAIASFADKESYYKQQYGNTLFSNEFLERMKVLQNAKNVAYIHLDPYRKSLGINDKVKGNSRLTFPNLEKVAPFPPEKLPDWQRDISVALSDEGAKIYREDLDYDKLVEEANAIKLPEVEQPKQQPVKK